MTFRINDYNAFLKSLYDRKDGNEIAVSPGAKLEDGDERMLNYKSMFPVDFDFGLIPPDANAPMDMEPPSNSTLFDTNLEVAPSAASHNKPPQVRSNSEPVGLFSSAKPGKTKTKSSHNVIEQRYRNKINDKFTSLQESVPSLRVVSRNIKENSDEADEEEEDYIPEETDTGPIDLEGLEPARNLSKGTILAKSVEYIKFLESKNSTLKSEQDELLRRARQLGIQLDENTFLSDYRLTSNE